MIESLSMIMMVLMVMNYYEATHTRTNQSHEPNENQVIFANELTRFPRVGGTIRCI